MGATLSVRHGLGAGYRPHLREALLVYQQDMSKAGGVAQPQGYPQAQPQGYPQAYPQAQPMVPGQPVELHRIRVTRYRMGGMSWCLVCLLILLFWPLCWIPCVCEQCQEPYEEEIIVGP